MTWDQAMACRISLLVPFGLVPLDRLLLDTIECAWLLWTHMLSLQLWQYMSHSTGIVTHICDFKHCDNKCMSHATGCLIYIHDSYCDSFVRSEIPSQQLRQYMGHLKEIVTHIYQVLFCQYSCGNTWPIEWKLWLHWSKCICVHYRKNVLIEKGFNFVSNEITSNDLGFLYQRFFRFGKITLNGDLWYFDKKINAHWTLARYSTKCIAIFTISFEINWYKPVYEMW